MGIYLFTLGFLSALVLVSGVLGALYYYLKRKRSRVGAIKGYLDLIPDLTQEQRDQVQEIRRTFLPKVEGIRQELCLKRMELARLLFAEPSDRTAIYAVAHQINRHQSELEQEVVEHILEEKEILSPPQKKKFYEIIVDQFSWGGLGVHDVKRERKG